MIRAQLITAPLGAIVAAAGVSTILRAQDMWLGGSLLAAAALILALPFLDRWSRAGDAEDAE